VIRKPGCWVWYGALDPRYGAFRFNGRIVKAHRVAWELAFGPVPTGLCVCHHCDNSRCVNPSHLFLGTPGDNVRDAVAKGRARGGPGGKKLKPSTVRKMRALWATGLVSQADLGKQFHTHRTNVLSIVHNRTWRELEDVKHAIRGAK